MARKKTYTSGEIADKKLRLRELNTNNNPTKREVVDVGEGKRIPPTQKPNYTYETL
jgi:cell division protein FtsL